MKRRVKKKKHSRWSKTAIKAFDLALKGDNLTPSERSRITRLRLLTKKAEKGW